MNNPSANQNNYPYRNEPTWSKSEKMIARRAFDAALGRELHEVTQKAKQMANEIQQSSDLWDLEISGVRNLHQRSRRLRLCVPGARQVKMVQARCSYGERPVQFAMEKDRILKSEDGSEHETEIIKKILKAHKLAANQTGPKN